MARMERSRGNVRRIPGRAATRLAPWLLLFSSGFVGATLGAQETAAAAPHASHHGAHLVAPRVAAAVAAVDRDERRTVPRGEETLFLATLTPQGGASSGGSGSATLTLAGDQTTARLRYDQDGLTGPLIAAHIHAPDGHILFDLDTATPAGGRRPDSGRSPPTGALTAAADPRRPARRRVLPEPAHRGLPERRDQGLPAPRERQPDLHAAAGAAAAAAAARPPRTTPPASCCRRPTGRAPTTSPTCRIAGLRRVARRAARAAARLPPRLLRRVPAAATPSRTSPGLVRGVVLEAGDRGPGPAPPAGRLRALRDLRGLVRGRRRARRRRRSRDYMDLLAEHAFGNFRELLEEVTLRPTMGVYLDMLEQRASCPETGPHAQRELRRARSCSSSRSASTSSTPTARCGSTPATSRSRPTTRTWSRLRARVHRLDASAARTAVAARSLLPPAAMFRDYRRPMEPWAAFHETGEKLLLDGVVLPRRAERAHGPRSGARRDLPAPQRRAVRLPAAHPAPGHQQPEPGLRLPLRPARSPTTAPACAATSRRWCAPSSSTTRRAAPRSRRARLRQAARAGRALRRRCCARSRPSRADGRLRILSAVDRAGASTRRRCARRRCSTSSSRPTPSPARSRRPGWSRRSSRSPPRPRSSAPPTSCSRCCVRLRRTTKRSSRST